METVHYHRLLKGLMCIAIAFGTYARLRGLGTWPWAEDEYFIAQSVANILQHGVPAFDCGGYYMRGITLQYLIVPLYLLGLHAELAARLVPVAFSFVALVAVYFLGKRLSGVAVACISVALLSLSLWEIEFARFARMYVPFQAIFLCYLLALHRVIVDRRSAAYGWLWLLSLLGVLTWAGGIFFLVVNFVPNLVERAPGRARHLAVNIGLLVLGYSYSAINFRFMGDQPPLPLDVVVDVGGSQFMFPSLLVSTLSSHTEWMMGALVLLLVSLAAIITVARVRSATVRERIAWVGLIALSFFNLFGCVLIGILLAFLLEFIDVHRASLRSALIGMLAIAANFAFWLAYALFTDGWHELFPGFGPGGQLSKLAVVLFKYPNIFDPVLFQWLAVVPVLTAVFALVLALAGARAIRARRGECLSSLRLTLAVLVLMAFMIGVVDNEHSTTRYTFFLLPVLYLVAVTVIYTLIVRLVHRPSFRGLALVGAMCALVGFTEDFGWAHMVHVDRMDWNYRVPLDDALSKHYYTRWDYRTPAEYVNRRARPNDTIISVVQPVTYYLNRMDYVYWNYRWAEFASFSCDGGRRERWSGSRLLYRVEDLKKVIDQAPGDVWLVTKLGWHLPREIEPAKTDSPTLVYRGLAGKIGVYRIDNAR